MRLLAAIAVLLISTVCLGVGPDDPRSPASGSKRDADFSAVKDVDLALPARWSAAPDPAPVVKTIERPIMNAAAGLFSNRGYAIGVNQSGDVATHTVLSRVDLIKGVADPRSSIHRQARIHALSPDGTLVLCGWYESSESNRVEVWKLGGIIAKRVISFLPFPADQPQERIYRLGFLDNDTGYVMNRHGELTVWQLSTTKALWRAKLSPTFVQATPGGAQLLVQLKESFLSLDAKTGKVLGAVRVVPTDVTEKQSGPEIAWAGVSPDGRRCAVALNDRFYTVDLAAGKYSGDVGWSRNTLRPEFLSEQFLLLGEWLIDTHKNIDVYRYTSLNGSVVGGKFWTTLSQGDKRAMVAVDLPHDRCKEEAEKADPTKRLALQSGAKVGIDLSLKVDAAQSKAVLDSLTAAAKANGWIVDPTAKVRLVAKHFQGHKLGVPAVGESPIDPKRCVAQLSVEVDGQVLWRIRQIREDGFWTDMFLKTRPPQQILTFVPLGSAGLTDRGLTDYQPQAPYPIRED